ncbi:Bug family tripartite tricarboxylate transporter substrate binding protein [Roseomonas elaeocarpi]|uniref:Bug family tripartite tricarboxylate transporter substrate binding protein n=1 Tax=Roseomonas elaeocarpi TaxID=907779 RepID=A0ABV6JQJ0_9PROT
MRRRALLLGGLVLGAGAGLLRAPALAQPGGDWPNQPIRLVVPFPPGAANDNLGRAIADQLSPRLKQPVVVENRAGAGGSVGSELVAHATPDGYTLLLGHIGTLAVNPAIYPRLPYDPVRDFAPVAMIASLPNVVVVNPKQPFGDVQALVAYARANPGKLRYCSAGNGSAGHIAMLAFLQATDTKMEHVPYRGLAQGMNDLVAGYVDLTLGGAPTVMPLVRDGLLRALAVTSANRVASLPELPTVAETVAPGFDVQPWYGIAAPRNTPAPIVERLNREINEVLRSPAVINRLEQEGAHPDPMTPDAFGSFIRTEVPRWGKLIRDAGVTAD